MAVTITDHRTIDNEADATTSWAGSPTLFTSDPDPVEATGSIGYVVSNTTVDAYVTITAANFTGRLIYVWVLPRGAMDTKANGGVAIHVGDGTNRVAYHLAGKDVAGFRHDDGPVAWMCLVLDQANLPSSKTVRAGSEGSLNWAAITQIGAMFKTLAKSVGGVSNCWVDVIRHGDPTANNGAFLSVVGGTSGDPGTWDQIATADRDTTTQTAYGIVRKLGSGLFGVQGPLRFGNSAGSSASWFQDTNVAVAFESRGLGTGIYGIYITDNGTGTTTFKLGTKVGSGTAATGKDGCSLLVGSGVGAFFDAGSDADVTDVFIYGTLFSGFTGGVKLRSAQELIDCTVSGSGVLTIDGAYTIRTAVVGSTVAANASAALWNVNTDPDGFMDFMSFGKGTNAHHAIEFGTTSPLTMTLRGIVSTGFNASNAQNDSFFHVKRTTGTVTINVIGSTGNFSYKTDGATVIIVLDPVTTLVTVKDTAGANIQNARVLIEAGDNAGDLPYLESVTISRSGSTATVSHTTHGLINGDKVAIRGAGQPEYNGVFVITNVSTNAYDYTVAGSPATPATGTITSTGVVVEGLTNASGQISASRTFTVDQNVRGTTRKTTASPIYKVATFTDIVDNVVGLTKTVQLVSDE